MRRRLPHVIVVAGCVMMLAAVTSTLQAQGAANGAGQGAASTVTPPVVQLTPGTRVQFVDPWHEGATVAGRVTRRWADSVAIHPDGDPAPTDYRIADLHEVSVSDGRTVSSGNVGRGALYGAIGGAVAGGLLLSFMHHVESPDKHTTGRGTEVGIAAAFGALAGAIGGALHAPEHWHAVSPQ